VKSVVNEPPFHPQRSWHRDSYESIKDENFSGSEPEPRQSFYYLNKFCIPRRDLGSIDAFPRSMHWKPFATRLMRSVSKPDHALLLELASGALLLAWAAHWAVD
jgi:hypothetical protein